MDYCSDGCDSKIIVPEPLETTIMGRAEYILFFSLFFNKEKVALDRQSKVGERFECVEEALPEITTVDNVKIRAQVLWAYWVGEFGEDVWSVGSCPSYYCEYIHRSKGNLLDPGQWGLTSIGKDQLHHLRG